MVGAKPLLEFVVLKQQADAAQVVREPDTQTLTSVLTPGPCLSFHKSFIFLFVVRMKQQRDSSYIFLLVFMHELLSRALGGCVFLG